MECFQKQILPKHSVSLASIINPQNNPWTEKTCINWFTKSGQ